MDHVRWVLAKRVDMCIAMNWTEDIRTLPGRMGF